MIRDRRAILALLTALNFLNYLDRYVMAAVVDPVMRELSLSNFEAGLLQSAFLIGYFVTSPLFGARADKAARKGLIALGITIWSVATFASGLAWGFWSLLAARAVVGVGEASFTALAPTIIDDLTPPDRKAKALAVFYLATPVGSALGYVVGGAIGKHWGWRAAFFATGVPGLALALLCLLIVEPPRKLVDARAKLLDGLREVAAIPLFRRATLGYCAYTAAVGAFSYWAPKFLLEQFSTELDLKTANFWFGAVLVPAGVISTLLGGWWADRSLRKLPPVPDRAPYDAPEHKAAVNALLRVCAIGMVIATPLAVLCFFVETPKVFFMLTFAVEIGLFLSASPVNAAFLRAVPAQRRASAMAASVFAIHLFGDLWSPPALGKLKDALPTHTTIAMMAIPLTFAVSAYLWWPRKREAAGRSSGTSRPGGLPEARVHAAT